MTCVALVVVHLTLDLKFTPVDDDRRGVEGRLSLRVVREVRVAEKDHRRLQLVGEVERAPRELERLGVVAGREDDARELALRGVDGEAEVGLLGPRGQAGRRPGPREQADDDRASR